jgi:hypothetical protein
MKACEVRILPALDLGESYIEPRFLLVETTWDEDGEPVTRIDQITTSRARDGQPGWSIATLGQSVPMTHPSAREWAVSYAASRDIPIVYERDETLTGNYAAALSAAAETSAWSSASPSK